MKMTATIELEFESTVRQPITQWMPGSFVAWTLCAEIREEKMLSREALFAGVKKLIDQIGLYACGPCQQVENEELGELSLFVDHPLDGRVFEPQ